MPEIDQPDIREVTSSNIEVMNNIADDLFDEPVTEELLADFLGESNHWMVVGIVNNEVIGKCTAIMHRRPDKPPELYIDEIDVIPRLRRQGIAKKILHHMLELADQRGCEECWLGTEKDNMAARRLYESNGASSEEFILYYLEY